jgi:hypothetical protein
VKYKILNCEHIQAGTKSDTTNKVLPRKCWLHALHIQINNSTQAVSTVSHQSKIIVHLRCLSCATLSAVLWWYNKHNNLLNPTFGLLLGKNGNCSLCSAPLPHLQCSHPLYQHMTNWESEQIINADVQMSTIRNGWHKQARDSYSADEWTANVQVSTTKWVRQKSKK